jgi:hypothetical protein
MPQTQVTAALTNFARVGQRFVFCLALAVAAGERWNDSKVTTAGVGLEYDVISGLVHSASVSCSSTSSHRSGRSGSGFESHQRTKAAEILARIERSREKGSA